MTVDPVSAMLQAPLLIALTGATAHQEHLHRRGCRQRRTFEGAFKPVQAAAQPVFRHLPVESRWRTKLRIATVSDITITMQPGAHDQPMLRRTAGAKRRVVGEGRTD